MTDPEEVESNQEFEQKVRSAFQIRDPDQLFIDRLQKELADRNKAVKPSTGNVDTHSGRSPWTDKFKRTLSPLAWGAIAVILILSLIWGIKSLIPRVEVGGSIPTPMSPIVSPSPALVSTQAEGAEEVINLPVPAGMPVPWPKEAINSSNASQIAELARWGKETTSTVTWAPDGNSFAVASASIIHIYDSTTLEEIGAIDNGSNVYQIAYSPDGKKLASVFTDLSIKIWDVASGSELLSLTGHKNFITHLAFSPDGEILASAAYQEPMKLWSVSEGQELRTLGSVSANNFAFSPDGTLLATTGGEDRTVRLWDVASGQELRQFSGHTDYVYGVVFSLDGKMLASSSNDLTIRLWEVATGNELKTFAHQSIPNGIAFLPDGNTMLSIAEGEPITLWDITRGQVLRTIDDTQGCNILLSPDGKMVLCYFWGQGSAISLLDVISGEKLRQLDWQSYLITSLAFSPDGSIVAAGLDTGGIKFLDAASGKELLTLAGHTKQVETVKSVLSLAFSPDGSMLASGAMDTTTRLWDVSTGEQLDVMDGVKEYGWAGGIPSVDFSPDGKVLVFAGPNGQVKLWDVTNHVELRTLGGQADSASADAVAAIAFSPDGKILASGYSSASITLWDALSGQVLDTLSYSSSQWLTGVSELVFSPDGKVLAAGYGDANVILWDVASGSKLHTNSFPWQDEITILVFSPDGQILAVGSGMGSFALLDVVRGKELITLAYAANGLDFSPDGKVLISGAYDGAIHVWGMPPLNAAQQEPAPVLTSEEVSPVQEPSPAETSEEVNIEKIPIPALLAGKDINPGDWSPDGSYFYYSQLGPIGEPGPDQATRTLYFLNGLTGESCQGIQETVTFTQTGWGPAPVGVDLYDRERWLGDNRLLYLSPNGELMAITPCSNSMDAWTVSLPDRITALTYSMKADGAQIVLQGEQAYWLFTPSTRQSVKLDLALPEEGMITNIGWLPGDELLYSSRIEDRGGLWIVIESIDPVTGAASLVLEEQASEELYNFEPKWASVDWIDKDLLVVYNTISGDKLIDLSSQPIQSTNLFPDLFGFKKPSLDTISTWGVMWGTGRQDYHLILETGGADDGQYYIYHPDTGVVDEYPLDPPLFVVFPSGEGGIVESYVTPPTNNIYQVILVDSDTEPYDLVVLGHAPRQGSGLSASILPGREQVLFSSLHGISLVDFKTGDTLKFWTLENQEQFEDFSAWLSPDGKTVIGYARLKSTEPGVFSQVGSMYWLRLEP